MFDDDLGLEALAQCAGEAGAAEAVSELERLRLRLAEGRFYVAVLGQFKRGKSSLINGLLEERTLPTGVTPVTAVVTVVRFGARRGATVRFQAGESMAIPLAELPRFVSEEQNPDNRRGVAEVEISAPCELLRGGMCLVDTPGLGSPLSAAPLATRAFVPHVDAALFVLGVDPPIGAEELGLLREVGASVREIALVLNKVDLFPPADVAAARAFTERVVAEASIPAAKPMFEVSAAEETRGERGRRDWPALRAHLAQLAEVWGIELLRRAAARELENLRRRLLRELDERLGALTRPLHESERRIESLARCARQIGQTVGDLGYLFEAEQDRLGRAFEARKREFVAAALPPAQAELAGALAAFGGGRGAARQEALAAAQEICERRVSAWRTVVEPEFAALYRAGAERLVAIAREFLASLTGAEDVDLPAPGDEAAPETGFRIESGVYFASLWNRTMRSPLRWLADSLRTRAGRRRALARETSDYLATLLFTNATRTENDFNARVRESRRSLESEVRGRLEQALASARRALERAQQKLEQGEAQVEGERSQVQRLLLRIQALAPRA